MTKSDLKETFYGALVALVLILGMLFIGSAFAAPGDAEARAVTRKWSSSDNSCSIVVVAPGKALSAAHCEVLFLSGGTIEGRAVTETLPIPGRDLMVVTVPGLACPCAAISDRGTPAVGTNVVVVGFPFEVPMTVLTRGEVQGPMPYEGEPYVLVTAPVGPGNSGGGVFVATDDGALLLVGIASMSPPTGVMMLYVEIPADVAASLR